MNITVDRVLLFLAWPLVAPVLLCAVACALILTWPFILTKRCDLS